MTDQAQEQADSFAWVEKTITVDAIDPAKDAIEANDGWRLLHVGIGSGGQTTLTYGWPATQREQSHIPRERADDYTHEDCTEFENRLLAMADDTWDDDVAQEVIVEAYVAHLVGEVTRLGGCLRKWCRWADNEPCDHGYLEEPVAREPSAPSDEEVEAAARAVKTTEDRFEGEVMDAWEFYRISARAALVAASEVKARG